MLSHRTIVPPEAHEQLTPEQRVRWDLIVAAVAVGVIILDQLTKHLIVSYFTGKPYGATIPLLDHTLYFEHVQNSGAAFSSFTNSPALLGFLIVVAIGVIAWLYWTTRPRAIPILKVTFGLIIGGALGNLIDRVRLGSVVDFIHFQVPHFDFAVFNVADSAITIGVILLAIIFWLLPRASEPAAEKDAIEGSAAPPDTITQAAAAPPASASTPPMATSARATTTAPKPLAPRATAHSGALPAVKARSSSSSRTTPGGKTYPKPKHKKH